jgi:hypothetical protein
MKTIIIAIATLINSYNHQQWEIYQAISDVEDYIEYTNEDYVQGIITEEEYTILITEYEKTLKELLNANNK